MSLVEAVTNVSVGYAIAVLAQMAVFPLFGIAVAFADHLLIGCAFTVASIARSYALRRLFEATRVRRADAKCAMISEPDDSIPATIR